MTDLSKLQAPNPMTEVQQEHPTVYIVIILGINDLTQCVIGACLALRPLGFGQIEKLSRVQLLVSQFGCQEILAKYSNKSIGKNIYYSAKYSLHVLFANISCQPLQPSWLPRYISYVD